MKGKQNKVSDFTITVVCPDLGINLKAEGESAELNDFVNKVNKKPVKAVINHSQEEFYEFVVHMWESKMMTIPGCESFEKFGDFISKTFEVRQIKNSDKMMAVSSLKRTLSNFKNTDESL